MSDTSGAAPVRILHLDDSPFDAELVKMTLEVEEKRFPSAVKYVQNREEYVKALEEERFDVILSDYRMPGFDGDQALRLALDKCPDTPFIMVTGELGEERVIETLQRGATDYVLKDRIFRLVPAIRRAIAEAENERKRKEAEEALRKAHRRTSEMLESIQDAFYSIDREWRFTYINRKAEELWELKAESIIGSNVYNVFPQAAGTVGMQELELAMRNGETRSFEFFSPVVHAWIDVHAYPTADGGLSVVFRDITERVKSEEAIRRQAALIDLTPDAIIVRTVGGTIVSWNKGAEELYGWKQDEVLGKETNEILRTQFPYPFSDIVKDLEVHGQWKGELVHFTRSGRQITVESRWLLYDDPLAGRLLMESNVDMTVRKQAETEREQLLQEVRRLNRELEARVHERTQELQASIRELESFSYTVSHDLRAPLQVISGYAELLLEERDKLNRQQYDRIHHILTNTERMRTLITALLDFARLAQKPLHETAVDMHTLVQAVVQEQWRTAGTGEGNVRVDIHDLPQVRADPVLIRQVMTNLLSNAFKYTRRAENPHIEIGAAVENGSFQFFVRDNGVGFPRDKAKKLFGVFQRLHAQSEFEGTGIGLANVRKIIERHGGKVWAEGEAGKGAAFFFTIPRKERVWNKKRK